MSDKRNLSKSFFLLKKSATPEIGFTTGTCAAAASRAAARMLFTQKFVPYMILTTPKGLKVFIEIEDAKFSKDFAICSARKYSGSDPDVTNGIKIFAKVSKMVTNFQRNDKFSNESFIKIEGGEGVGHVTLPGLDQKIGEWAINSVPRKMIFEGIETEIKKNDENCALQVEIFVPGGEEIAKKTFNPKLGIVGGISILGTDERASTFRYDKT